MSPGQESVFERRVSQQTATQPIISALYTVRFGPLRAKYSLDREHPPLTNARASEQNSKERETHSRTSSKHPKLRQTTVVHKVRTIPRPPRVASRPGSFPRILLSSDVETFRRTRVEAPETREDARESGRFFRIVQSFQPSAHPIRSSRFAASMGTRGDSNVSRIFHRGGWKKRM